MAPGSDPRGLSGLPIQGASLYGLPMRDLAAEDDGVVVVAGPPAVSRAELERRVRQALAGTRVERAILFGSFARGTADALSDVDLVLIEPTDRPFVERGLAHPALFRLGVGVDLLVYTPQEWARMREEANPLAERVTREGVPVYARPEG